MVPISHLFYFLFIAIISLLSVLLIKSLETVAEVMTDLYNYVNPKNGRHSPLISKETYDIIMANADVSGEKTGILTLYVPIMTNINFLPLISIHCQETSLRINKMNTKEKML